MGIQCAVKLEVVRLIQDWKENSNGTIGCYSIEHEIIPTVTVSVRLETLEGGHTGSTFGEIATTYLSTAVGGGLTGSTDRRWCCTYAQSCHARRIDQEHGV